MAITAAGSALSAQHYRLQLAIRAAYLTNLARLWPMFAVTDFATFDAFSQLAATLVVNGRSTSTGIALTYLSAFAMAEGQPAPVAVTPSALDPAIARDELRATGLLGVLDARRGGFTVEAAKQVGWVRLAGSAGSLILGGGRQAVVASVAATPGLERWQRITSGKPCGFCAMLASRGAVYHDEGRAGFEAHDHCSCTIEPAYEGSRMTPLAERFRGIWETATHGLSGADALNAFRTSIAAEETS